MTSLQVLLSLLVLIGAVAAGVSLVSRQLQRRREEKARHRHEV